MTSETRVFERLVAELDYPMYVVTTAAAEQRAGCLVGFATQCSIDPPRFVVCLSKNNHTHEVAAAASTIAVNLLPRDARDLAALFGEQTGDEVDKFERCEWQPGPDSVPILTSAYGWFAGRVLDRIDGGDHTVYVIEPFAGEQRDAGPPVMFQQVKTLEPGHPA